jgi:hypothetical protein
MESKRREVAMATKACLYCGNTFSPSHGNSNYCPGKDCDYQAKLERQTKNYVIGEDAKKAIQKNHKIIKGVLGDKNYEEFDLMLLLKKGFDHNGYYGQNFTKETKKPLYKVYDCYFHITSDNPQKIQLWKI